MCWIGSISVYLPFIAMVTKLPVRYLNCIYTCTLNSQVRSTLYIYRSYLALGDVKELD